MTLREISRYSVLVERLSRAEEMHESMQNASRPDSAVIELMPKSSVVRAKIGNLSTEIEDMVNRIEHIKREIKRETVAINRFINSVPDEGIRMAMRLKFIHNFTWGQTVETLGNNYTVEGIKKAVYRYLTPPDSVNS